MFVAVLEGFCCYTFRLVGYVLLDIIQSTKMAPFQVVFEQGNKKKSQGLRSGEYGGLGTFNRNAFFCQKFIDGDCRVTWGVVVVQHSSACNAWSHTCQPFPESLKDFSIQSLIDSLFWWHKFLVGDPLTVKKKNKKEHRFDFGFNHSRFLVCHSRLWRFVSGSYSKNHDSYHLL